ncbi:MAG: carbohydrate-binding domain-containing protein [Lachnospiraceae bacterium]
MRVFKKAMSWILSLTLALPMIGVSSSVVGQANADAKVLAGFVYAFSAETSTYEEALEEKYGNKTDGYLATQGDTAIASTARLFASVDAPTARKLEWTKANTVEDDPETEAYEGNEYFQYHDTYSPVPVMTGGASNPWGVQSYFKVQLSTTGYENLTFSALLGGSKKGPRNYQLQYSLDDTTYYDIDGAAYSIQKNKKMEQAFDEVLLPDAVENQELVYIRLLVDGYETIGQSSVLYDEATATGLDGGDAAINDIIISGVSNGEQGDGLGDVNGDGQITSVDALLVLNPDNLTNTQLVQGDVDESGTCDGTDVLQILKMASGEITEYEKAPKQETPDEPTEPTEPTDPTDPTDPDDSEQNGGESVSTYGAKIVLADSGITIDGTGVAAEDGIVTIQHAGTYEITGSLSDGQIRVEADHDTDTVEVLLNNVTLSNSTSAPFYVVSADKTKIVLADDSENTFTDASTYVYAEGEDEPNACIFAKDDLTIKAVDDGAGTGALIVNGNYNNGIHGKDDLKITGGHLTVSAVNNGIKGKDSVTIKGGTLDVTAGVDGIESDNEEDATKGIVTISGGDITVEATDEGICAFRQVVITGGNINVTAGDSSLGEAGEGNGIKGQELLWVQGGTIDITCYGDGLKAKNTADETVGNITIDGGMITIKASDDGVHAEQILTVNDGTIDVQGITSSSAYEGLEALIININGGNIHVLTSDDGINAYGGTDNSGNMGPGGGNNRPSFGGSSSSSGSTDTGTSTTTTPDGEIHISGGYVYVNAQGDGIDANGSIEMSGGIVLVCGPTGSGNGGLDYDSTCTMTGGTMIVCGSTGMVQGPSSVTGVYGAMTTFTGTANEQLVVTEGSGNGVFAFKPVKTFGSCVIYSDKLTEGTSYTISSGTCSEVNEDGYCGDSSATYTTSSSKTTFQASASVSSSGGGGW